MARLDDLVAQVADSSLRREMEAALAAMKRRQRFGLVFEDHIPETTVLHGVPIQTGWLVQRRDDSQARTLYRVMSTTPQGEATIEPAIGGEPEQVPVGDLLAVKRFGEPMYPALTPLGSVRRGGKEKPHHALINGENFRALPRTTEQFSKRVDALVSLVSWELALDAMRHAGVSFSTLDRDRKICHALVDICSRHRRHTTCSPMNALIRA